MPTTINHDNSHHLRDLTESISNMDNSWTLDRPLSPPTNENPFDITLRNIRTCSRHPKLRVKKQTWNYCHYCGLALIPFNGEYEP